MSERNNRKELVGMVTNNTGVKSVKVTFDYKIPHPLYGKEIKRKTIVHVHDETNACKVGDKVRIMATRPLSKLKRWRIVEVLQKAPRS
ncbi:MAG: 30S ribosomal protein S17 [Opitutales bacterium]